MKKIDKKEKIMDKHKTKFLKKLYFLFYNLTVLIIILIGIFAMVGCFILKPLTTLVVIIFSPLLVLFMP